MPRTRPRGSQLQDNTVDADQIAANAITSSELADNSVDTGAIINGAIINVDVNASAAIVASKLALSVIDGAGATANASDAEVFTSQSYVDAVAQGFGPKRSVRIVSTAALAGGALVVYNNGTAGVGATITGEAAGSAVSINDTPIDGITLVVNDRVLVAGQADATQNGIYIVTVLGVVATTAYKLTRATDFDNSPVGEIIRADYALVEEGDTNGGSRFAVVSIGTGTGNSHVIATDDIDFTLISNPTDLIADPDGAASSLASIIITGTGLKLAYNATTESFIAADVGTTAANATPDGESSGDHFGSVVLALNVFGEAESVGIDYLKVYLNGTRVFGSVLDSSSTPFTGAGATQPSNADWTGLAVLSGEQNGDFLYDINTSTLYFHNDHEVTFNAADTNSTGFGYLDVITLDYETTA